MKNLKITGVMIAAIFLAACSSGGGGNGGGGNGPTPPPIVATGVNIGNVATIPLGNGGGSTSAIVSNNYSDQLVLQTASYIIYGPSGTSSPQDAMLPGSLVNPSLCKTLQPKATCTISLRADSTVTQGQYLITLNFLNLGDNKVYSTSQLISYSTAVSVNDVTGVQVSPINNTLYNVANGLNSYSIPFVLTKTAPNLSAFSDRSNAAFSPTLSCEGSAPYPAGTACTLFIHISQTGNAQLISGNVTVTTNAGSGLAQPTTKIMGIKGTTGYLFNVPVTIIQNNAGNLITSAVNVIVNPADGTSPQTITLFNNGAGPLTGITLYGTGPTVIGSNGCTGSLNSGNYCTFTVNATVNQNSQGAVVANYTSNGNNYSLAFNVIYIIPNSTVGLSMTASSTDLSNTVVNTTNTTNINVKNTGLAALTNIAFTAVNLINPAFNYTTTGSCLTNGNQSLNAGQSCTLILSYSPTAIQSGTIVIRGTANYTYNSLTGSYESATATITYSAINGSAFVYITPNYVAYSILADNNDSASQTFTIVNAGQASTTVTTENLANPAITGYNKIGGTCSFPQSLESAGSGTESCTVIAQYGPVTGSASSTSQMTATYLTSGTTTATAFANLAFTASNAALVSISNIAQTGATSGNGQTSGTAYNFTNSPLPGGLIQFTITYQNTGTESAFNFSVALNTLPVGYYSVGGTCNIGATSNSTLNPGNTCTVIFAAVSSTLYNPYSLNGDLSFNLPGWSYNDSTGLNINSNPNFTGFTGGKVWVNANAFSDVVESPALNFTGAISGSSGVNNLTFTGTPNGTVVTIQNLDYFIANISFGSSGTCTILSGVCTIGVDNQSGLPISTYNFFYVISPAGGSPSVGIIKSGQFTYIN